MELTINNLSKEYGEKKAVRCFNVTLTNGVYGLLGANGAGKTTLMRMICDVQSETNGAIMLNGQNIHDLAKQQGLECVGFGAKTKWYFTLNALIREFVGYLRLTWTLHTFVAVLLMVIIAFAA